MPHDTSRGLLLRARDKQGVAILELASVLVLLAIVAAFVAREPATKRFFDNVHWTLAYASAAVLAWRGTRGRDNDDRATTRWFAWSLTAYAIGQVLWDVQVVTGWNPFPGPSDLLYVWLGAGCGAGLLRQLRRGASPTAMRTAWLDMLSLSAAVLALTLALYLPRRGDQALLPMVFLTAYPVVLSWAACVGIILVLTLHLAPTVGWMAFLAGLAANVLLWLQWNSLTLDQGLQDGTLFNAGFSVAALLQGAGAWLWHTERSESHAWAVTCEALLRLLPLFNVVVSAGALVLAYTLPDVPAVVRLVALVGALVVVVLSSIRQTVLLGDRERLIGAERALRKQQESLRALEAQLVQAQKLEAVGSLATGVAHDFNNLLTAIRGNADLIRYTRDPGEVASFVAGIDEATDRATALVKRILAFSRPHQPTVAPVVLAKLCEEVGRLLRATLPAGIELVVDVPDPTLTVSADAAQLHQVLVNLATNAWQAMEGKVGKIEIRARRREGAELSAGGAASAQYACISVHDDGHGMEEATRARIFEPFFTTKPPGKGTGLGLSVVHGIVRSHGGRVEVESEPGVGTTFHVLLPAAADRRDSTPAPEAERTTKLQRRTRVLYIDDEASIVAVMTQLFNLRGYQAVGFSSPEEALAFAKAQPNGFDVVVSDYNMPKMSGLDMLRELHALRPDVPAVLMSGYLDSKLQAEAERVGVKHVAQKPQSFEALCDVIDRVARQGTGEATGEAYGRVG